MLLGGNRLLRQPFVGTVTAGCALLVVVLAWLSVPPSLGLLQSTLLLALVLAGTVPLAFHFPVHLLYHHKIEMTTVPVYLMAVLLPAPLAATAAGLGILAGELAVRHRRGSYPGDIATGAGRIALATLVAALVAGAAPAGPFGLLPFILAALTLWLGDILTLPLVLAPMGNEPVDSVILAGVREGGPAELAQYLLGLVGALMAQQQPWALLLLVVPLVLLHAGVQRTKQIHARTRAALAALEVMLADRDPATAAHSRRVAALTGRILREIGLGRASGVVALAAQLHDIGKLVVPDTILQKPGPLTADEWAVMCKHAEAGADLLKGHPGFAHGVEIVRHHHEHWDGTGYPHQLAGTQIPLGARVLAVADSYDAMTSDRPYQLALSPRVAADILRAGRGTQWDPAIVDVFLRCLEADLAAYRRPAYARTARQAGMQTPVRRGHARRV